MRNYYIMFALGIVVGILFVTTAVLLLSPNYHTEYRYWYYFMTLFYTAIVIMFFKQIKKWISLKK